MKERKRCLIDNAHLDPAWLWQEGFQETKATFRSARDRMNESAVTADKNNLIGNAIKRTADNADLIVRCNGMDVKRTNAEIALPRFGRALRADFGPAKIKTFRVPRKPGLPVTEPDLPKREVG